MKSLFRQIEIHTGDGIDIHDVTGPVREQLAASGIRNGFCVVASNHTTTALAVNEFEERLLDDIKAFLARLAPADTRYKHNDIALRDCPPDEPENAHSHLMAMMLGSTENIPVVNGELQLGKWQSLLFFELDGPRERRVNVQVVGE
jgi:secondary thiamine-phosphate synthase enzyme